ncbi:MAG: DNA polymerase III subunit beta [Deltaproteobacteria bacterium]|nr:DNA polymerase III subunit beta [Deltaproteobacteria bacterium]
MELRIPKEDLARAVGAAQGIVPKKSTMPILSNVLLEAREGGELMMAATDLDVAVRIDGRADVTRPGAVTVAARNLYEIVKATPGPTVGLKRLDNHYVEVTSGRFTARMVGMAAEEYPKVPDMSADRLMPLEPALLKEMIDKTLYSVSTDETRYVLNGVYMEPGPDTLNVVSTDGHRLSLCTRKVPGVQDTLKRAVIMPRKGLAELRRMLDDGEGDVQLGFRESHAVAKRGNVTLVMRLIDGRFPDYRQVVPQQADRKVKIARAVLMDGLKRVSLVSSDRSNAVRVELSKDLLRISSQNPDLGEASEEIPVDYTGTDLKIGFNARYLMDALNAVGVETVQLEVHDELSPGLVRGADDLTYTCVVMPMRI